MTGVISIFEVFTIALGVALGVFIGLMLFAWWTAERLAGGPGARYGDLYPASPAR